MGKRPRSLIRPFVLSCLSGLLFGLAARITMRYVALESGISPDFSLGGSLEVIALGALLATPAAFAFLAFRARIQRFWPWAGLAFGLSLFGMLSVIQPPSARSALAATPDTPMATAIAFGVLFATWGLALEFLALSPWRGASELSRRKTTPP